MTWVVQHCQELYKPMENNVIATIHNLIDIIAIGGMLVLGIPYLRGQKFRGDSKAQSESNEILRKLVDDQKAGLQALEDWQKEAIKKIALLEAKVEELTSKKTDLEKLIATALADFFERNPEIAKDIDGKYKNVL